MRAPASPASRHGPYTGLMKVVPAAGRGTASARFIAIYAFAYASLWLALLTPAIITLALRVRQLAPGNAAEPISRVLMAGAIVALISNPIFGALSDSTRSRFGRRRPWLVGGVLCGCASLAAIGLAPTINLVLLGWCAAQLSFNAVLAAMVAIIPDRIAPAQRGTVVGILGVCMPIGQITGTWLVQQLSINMTLALVVPGVIGVAGVLSLVIILRQQPLPQTAPVQVQPAATGQEAPAGHRDFSWAWLSRVFFTTGSCFLQAYQPFFLLDALHLNDADVPRLMFRSTLVQAAMVVVWSLISGRLSDRTGLRKPFVMAGSTIQGLGLWLIAFSNSYTMLLLGVGIGRDGAWRLRRRRSRARDRRVARPGPACGQGPGPAQHSQHAPAGDRPVGRTCNTPGQPR